MSHPGNRSVSVDAGCICRDENCERLDVHAAHDVPKVKKERPPSPGRELWKRSAPKALDHAIAKATSKHDVTHFGAILNEVRNDYGDCEERTVYRRLKRFVERGHMVKLDLGLSMAGYIRPKSKLLGNPDYLRERLLDKLDVRDYRATA